MTGQTVRHFLRDDDLTPAEQAQIIDRAIAMKQDRFGVRPFEGPQAVAIIFDKPTLRTQVSFMAGIAELGGFPFVVDGNLAQIGVRESIADSAKVLTRAVSAIVWRTSGQDRIEEMAANSTVPVVNALTDQFHPCQILADLQTIKEHKGTLAGLTFAYLGDAGNNMANSYAIGMAMAGMHVRIAGPGGHQPAPEIVARAKELAASTGGSVTVTGDGAQAAKDADVVVTDTWVSMGMEAEKAQRRGEGNPFASFQVNVAIMGLAKPDAIFMHCLPAYRGFEVSASVIDGPASVVFDEAENRLHAQKALLAFLVEAGR
ncbi:MAG: ornithine carbamoyltransferase [Austwickia sp.]|nr:ornithine carbamoyltransferase [Actinomycetota bacterium]MCB1252493.1 ornithine carbamoyltransferase [Austwickia sp.]MCO5308709.1 ornithine carbamoyltransferase [Austwickia sp.]